MLFEPFFLFLKARNAEMIKMLNSAPHCIVLSAMVGHWFAEYSQHYSIMFRIEGGRPE